MNESVEESPRRFETFGEAMSRRLASRHSRRSMIGMVGGASLALALGRGAFDPSIAWATCSSGCSCTGNNSRTCNDAYGINSCPAGTCECGFWDVCACGDDCGGAVTTPPCGGSTPVKRWRDCCKSSCSPQQCCAGECGDRCAPQCCNDVKWGQGCFSTSYRIACRYWTCHTSAACP